MAEVLLSPSHIPSSSSSSFSPGGGGELSSSPAGRKGRRRSGGGGGSGGGREKVEEDQLSLLTLLVAAVRKSLVGCRKDGGDELQSMEIGGPTNVRHLVHVTFDRFHGFLGLPVELEPEVPRRPPSASASVFGVSTESMQCSYDPRGNSVPTILLLMQRRLYEHGGLQAEGIFRINAENSQEEHVRGQLNSGIVPDDIDVHCLAGLIKAWFRELPSGVLDPLTPEQVMASQTEDDCAALAKLLPPPQAALLDWAVNLMADVAQHELHNKMNARNVAMVFAPNMTQMADPLTALMYAVQVMNLLKTLILRTLRERQEAVPTAAAAALPSGPSDEDDQNGAHLPIEGASAHEGGQSEPACSPDEAVLEKKKKKKPRRTSLNPRKGAKKTTGQAAAAAAAATTTLLTKKSKEATTSNVSRINPRIERAEAWR